MFLIIAISPRFKLFFPLTTSYARSESKVGVEDTPSSILPSRGGISHFIGNTVSGPFKIRLIVRCIYSFVTSDCFHMMQGSVSLGNTANLALYHVSSSSVLRVIC
jgi:hypothetical protein